VSLSAVVAAPVPLTGAQDPATDSGVSSTDGITNDNQPRFDGTAQPNLIVQLYVTPLNQPGSVILAGTTTASAQGLWSIVSSPLADGRYAIAAQEVDPASNTVIQTIQIMPTSARPALVIDTTGPTVVSVALVPKARQLQVALQDTGAALNPAGVHNAANFHLALVVGKTLRNFKPRKLTVASGTTGTNEVIVDVTYNLRRPVRPGTYVVTLVAGGLTDLAGNGLVEHTLVKYPQTTNSPDPDYIAAITVNSRHVASAPHRYIPAHAKRARKR
jgi:hypothetical protein